MKFYCCSEAMLNYSIITGGPSLQMRVVPLHTVVLRLHNSPNLRICSRLGSQEVFSFAALSSIYPKNHLNCNQLARKPHVREPRKHTLEAT